MMEQGELGRGVVEPLYSGEEERPGMAPVVLFKIVQLQHLDGIAPRVGHCAGRKQMCAPLVFWDTR